VKIFKQIFCRRCLSSFWVVSASMCDEVFEVRNACKIDEIVTMLKIDQEKDQRMLSKAGRRPRTVRFADEP